MAAGGPLSAGSRWPAKSSAPPAVRSTSYSDSLADQVLPYPFGNGHPRFFAWGNPPPALEGVLADFAAAAMNPGCAGGDHAAIYLEQCVTRWLAELVGFPGDGVLVSGGADGPLTALAAARHRASLDDGWDDRRDGFTSDQASRYRLYGSDETHSCQREAARLLGLGDAGVRLLPTDRAGRLDADALAADRSSTVSNAPTR